MSTSAKVQVMLEIESGSSWGDKCQLDQVYKQGREGAIGFLLKLITEHGDGRIRVIGEAKVIAVTTSEDKP